MIVEVVDGNCVVVSNRVSATGYEIKIGNIVTLDGLAAPRLGERGGVEAREGLSEWVLGKQVNVHETLDMGISRGVILYATEFPRRFMPEDNVNLMMLQAGLAKWTGVMMTDSVSPEAMMEAQHLAQKEGRGFWNPAFSATNEVETGVLDKSSNPSETPARHDLSDSLVDSHAESMQATSPQPVRPPPTARPSSVRALLVAFCLLAVPIALALANRLNKRR